MKILITTSPGLEEELKLEIKELIGKDAQPRAYGPVELDVNLQELTRLLCGSHLASRILMPIASFHAWEIAVLYKEVCEVPWESFFSKSDTFMIDAHGRTGNCDYSIAQGLLKIKDALVDRLRDKWGERPSVDKESPSFRVEVFFSDGSVELSVDLTLDPLHRRGYRQDVMGVAPLRESRAACLVRMALAKPTLRKGVTQTNVTPDGPVALFDAFCGSGTILIEAALMLRKIPPAAFRFPLEWRFINNFSKNYQETLRELESLALPKCPIPLTGTDLARGSISRSRKAAENAGVLEDIHFEQRDFKDAFLKEGILVSNPPFGERLGDEIDTQRLLADLGRKTKFDSQLSAMVLLVPSKFEKAVGLRPNKKMKWKAGPLDLSAVRYELNR